MIIDKPGIYTLTENITAVNSDGVPFQVRRGVINITKINESSRQVYSPDIGYWVGWDIPATPKKG